MIKLKVTEEYRVDSEQEVKSAAEAFRQDSLTNGYVLDSFSYKKKEKKKSGAIIDEGYLLKVSKIYGGFWDGLEDN